MSRDESSLKARVQGFLGNATILIIEPEAGSQTVLRSCLLELGADPARISWVGNPSLALSALPDLKPTLLISESGPPRENWFDVIHLLREGHSAPKPLLSIIVSGNSSQVAVSRAIRADFDAFFVKPFSRDHLSMSLARRISKFLDPPASLGALQEVDELIRTQRFEEARIILLSVLSADPRFVPALHLMGRLEAGRGRAPEAIQLFRRAVQLAPAHVGSWSDLCDLQISTKDYPGAYESSQALCSLCPGSQEHLQLLLRLAMMTGNYADLIQYQSEILALGQADEALSKSTTAALIATGRQLLRSSQGALARTLFQAALLSLSHRTWSLGELLRVWLETGNIIEASAVLELARSERRPLDSTLVSRLSAMKTGAGEVS